MVVFLFSQDLHDYKYFVLDCKCAEYELSVLEKFMPTPSNGEEKKNSACRGMTAPTIFN
jgi:hypothetical protein